MLYIINANIIEYIYYDNIHLLIFLYKDINFYIISIILLKSRIYFDKYK